jgi:class 3 adenylate cyclase
MSDRSTDAATPEERIDDIRAVMDAAGIERAVIFGGSEGGSMACLFAATYPHRTISLILWGVQARWIRTADYPWGQTPEEYRKMVDKLEEEGITLDYLTGGGAGARNADPEYLQSFLRYARAGASPSAAVALEKMNALIDIRGILPAIHVPTLVMNRTGDPLANVEAVKDLASRIQGAKFVEFPGDTHQMTGIQSEVLGTIEEFVTGTKPHATADRILATILFVDVVGSTDHLVRIGDKEWRSVLSQYYNLVRRELAAFRGVEVKILGDGFVARFDGPTRAVECAKRIRDSVHSIGIDVRAGLHAGECELMGEDVGGIAVHVAARVAIEARPDQILVTNTVKDLVAGSRLGFEDRGARVLKGIPGEPRLFEVL